MIVFYGKSSSGKSEQAEKKAVAEAKRKNSPLVYLATMANDGSQAAMMRIAHHKSLRAGKGFTTIEEPLDLTNTFEKCQGAVVLLECLSNLLANKQYALYGDKPMDETEIIQLAETIFQDIIGLSNHCSQLIVVTNDIFDTKASDAWCQSYMRTLGLINYKLAQEALRFVEVSFGICNRLK